MGFTLAKPEQLKDHPSVAPTLIAFYDTIFEAALPGIDTGHFIHSPHHVLNDLAEYGLVPVADHVIGIVFGSDGGGNLLAVDPSGAIHRSTSASWSGDFDAVATNLVDFLEQLQRNINDFAGARLPKHR
ncbi:hypothetical protein OG535_07935 [Kitasatospora sp. NBC_00085]|uniref:hypothetical protein n=1 Tax=unclassified Kitasatospora TaxID=2633591 RepID=UPI003245D17B